MSIALMAVAWRLDLPTTEKMVLLALADAANDAGVTWIAVRSKKPGEKLDLLRKCSLSERALQGAIKRLVEGGHLTRTEKPGKGVDYIVHPGAVKPAKPDDDKPETPAANAPRSKCGPQQTTQTPAADAGKPSTTVIPTEPTVPTEVIQPKPEKPFDVFWRTYPRRTAKAAAEKAWLKAVKRAGDAEPILSAAARYAADPPDDPQFIPHPATWLNQARYEDEETTHGKPTGTRRPMAGNGRDHPPLRRNPAMDMLRDALGGDIRGFAGEAEADEGASGGYRGTGLALSASEQRRS